jgi:hypothetical protein
MNSLLIVIPLTTDDAWRAEALCDWIYQVGGKRAEGHCLLAPSSDVHGELKTKVRLAAEMAFVGVETFDVQPCGGESKADRVNGLFRQVASHISGAYRFPFLWLEPDCVPLRKGWIKALADAYANQPKRYMGSHLALQPKDSSGKHTILARTSIYPATAIRDLDGYCQSNVPFERLAAPTTVPRSSKTKLIQQIAFTEDTSPEKVRDDAVLLHHDKTGALIEMLRVKTSPPPRRGNAPSPIETP